MSQGCRNGDSCFFSHDFDQSTSFCHRPSLSLREDESADASALLNLFPTSSDGCVLVLDDTDFHFSSHLSRLYDPSKMISTCLWDDGSLNDPSQSGIRILWGLSHPCQAINSKAGDNAIPWNEVDCVLWFPKFDSNVENREEQKSLVQTFFELLAVRILAEALYKVQVILTMDNIRFSQLRVEKLGRESFFFLRESFVFDESSFGKLSDRVTSKKPMLVSLPISYVFDLNPPADVQTIQFGDCNTVIQ